MTSQVKTKEFDCIAMKRDAQARIYDQIRGMSVEEQIDYFRTAVRSSRLATGGKKQEVDSTMVRNGHPELSADVSPQPAVIAQRRQSGVFGGEGILKRAC